MSRSKWIPLTVVFAGLVTLAILGSWLWRLNLIHHANPAAAGQALAAADSAHDSPLVIKPVAKRLLPVSATEWQWIQQQLQPPRTSKATSSYCLHLLRLHGLAGTFQDATLSSSTAILNLLVDEEHGRAYFGRPALVSTSAGARFPTGNVVAVSSDGSLEHHRDHTLAAFAELNLPLSYPLRIAGQHVPLREVLRDSLANFHLRQDELAWTALAYALYLPPTRTWRNRYDEHYSFDDLTAAMISRPMDKESCGGTHLLYTLTLIARADEQHPILSPRIREQLWKHLTHAVCVVVRNQQADGSLHPGWNYALLPRRVPEGWSYRNDKSNRVIMTGHLAEWMMYLPASLQAPNALERAGHWLRCALHDASTELKEQEFCPYTHAACLVRQLAFVSGRTASFHLATDE